MTTDRINAASPRWWCRFAHRDHAVGATGLDLYLSGQVLWTAWCDKCERTIQWREQLT